MVHKGMATGVAESSGLDPQVGGKGEKDQEYLPQWHTPTAKPHPQSFPPMENISFKQAQGAENTCLETESWDSNMHRLKKNRKEITRS